MTGNAVAFDAIMSGTQGVGSSDGLTKISWNHNFGNNANAIVVAVNGYGGLGYFPVGPPPQPPPPAHAIGRWTELERSVKVGGVSLTLQGISDLWAGGNYHGWGEIWTGQGTSIGAFANTTQLVEVVEHHLTDSLAFAYLNANSASYKYTLGIGQHGGIDNYGPPMSWTQFVDTGDQDMVVAMHVGSAFNTAGAGCSGTFRWQAYFNGWNEQILVQDTPGTGSPVRLTVTRNNGFSCGCVVNLIGGGLGGIPPVITTTELGEVVRNVAFSQTIVATGYNITWEVISGALPDGLILNAATGTIYGLPTAYNTPYSFTLRATNDIGHADQSYSGLVGPNFIPYNPDSVGKVKQLLGGHYYPVPLKHRSSGTFKNVLIKD